MRKPGKYDVLRDAERDAEKGPERPSAQPTRTGGPAGGGMAEHHAWAQQEAERRNAFYQDRAAGREQQAEAADSPTPEPSQGEEHAAMKSRIQDRLARAENEVTRERETQQMEGPEGPAPDEPEH